MLCITKLPAKVLRNLFSNFCLHYRPEYDWLGRTGTRKPDSCDTRTLFNLCLVSRRIRDATQESLHHTFDPVVSDHHGRRLEPFLRTIIAPSELAGSVKVVFLRERLLENLSFEHGPLLIPRGSVCIWEKGALDVLFGIPMTAINTI
jgi:hypothetical protein